MWKAILSLLLVIAIFSVLDYGPRSIVETPDEVYDYIVVGAGTAGCVIASRLVENPKVTVLLVEAGNTVKFYNRIPLLTPAVQLTDSDWQYRSVPQKYSSKGLIDNEQRLPRGRGLGGSGQINYMLHTFGRFSDYIDWPEDWTYAKLEPYFRKFEKLMPVERQFTTSILSEAMSMYQRAISHFEIAWMTTFQGARVSSYRIYLQKVWHKQNLHILIDSVVQKILIDNNVTTGIELLYANKTVFSVNVFKEVILCAGTYGSPQILMASGVGPKKELDKFGISVKNHLPKVGRNLFDHLNMPLYVKFKNPPHKAISITYSSLLKPQTVLDYVFRGTGLLASNGIIGITQTNGYAVILTAIGTIDKDVLAHLSNYQPSIFEKLFPTHNDGKSEGFLLLTTCLQPLSRGRVTLQSANIRKYPLIDPNYLSRNEDVNCHIQAMRKAKEIAKSPQFIEYGGELHLPSFQECQHFRQSFDDDDYATCVLRIGAVTSHHPGGTCLMGSNRSTSVVDDKLQVHDIKKLRIVDASVLPNPISGSPNSVIIAIAEKAAKLILESK